MVHMLHIIFTGDNDKNLNLVDQNGHKLKRLLEFNSEDVDVTSAVACRNALFPPVQKEERGTSSNRFPAWAAEKFFKSVRVYALLV